MSRRRSLLALAALLAALTTTFSTARAAAILESVDYFSPVVLRLTVSRELAASATLTGTANDILVTRYGNRELLESVVATHGGALADWRLVAYANSENFDDLGDLVIQARHRDGRLVPVQALDFSSLYLLPATSDDYGVTRSISDSETLTATFDQKRVATCAQTIAHGDFDGGGTVISFIRYGLLRFRGQTLRAFTPGRATLDFVGTHTSSAGTGVARLSVVLGSPRLVPVFSASTGLGPIDISAGGGTGVTPD